MLVQHLQQIIFGKQLYFLKIPRHIQNILFLKNRTGIGQLLSNCFQEAVL